MIARTWRVDGRDLQKARTFSGSRRSGPWQLRGSLRAGGNRQTSSRAATASGIAAIWKWIDER